MFRLKTVAWENVVQTIVFPVKSFLVLQDM